MHKHNVHGHICCGTARPGALERTSAGIRWGGGWGGVPCAQTLLLRGGVGSLGQLHCLCVYKHFAVAITKTVSCA